MKLIRVSQVSLEFRELDLEREVDFKFPKSAWEFHEVFSFGMDFSE